MPPGIPIMMRICKTNRHIGRWNAIAVPRRPPASPRPVQRAVIAARAARRSADASLPRRAVTATMLRPAPVPLAHTNPAAPDHAPPGPAGPGAPQRPGPEAQRQILAPDANPRPPNPSVAPAPPTSQPSPTPIGNHAGEPGRPDNKQPRDTRGQERAKPTAPATPAGTAAKAPIEALAATPAPQHAGPTVAADHIEPHAPHDRPLPETAPATPPK